MPCRYLGADLIPLEEALVARLASEGTTLGAKDTTKAITLRHIESLVEGHAGVEGSAACFGLMQEVLEQEKAEKAALAAQGEDVDDEDEAAENPEEAEEPLKEEPAVEEASAGKQAVLLEFDFNTAKKGKKKKAKPKKPV